MPVKAKFVKVLIDKGPMAKIMKEVPEYDLPVLIEKHGALEPENEFVHESDDIKTVEEEVDRLTRLGVEPGTNQSYFSIAYGAGRSGMMAFEKAYNAAFVKAKASKTKVAKKAAPKKEEANEAEVASEKDPLE